MKRTLRIPDMIVEDEAPNISVLINLDSIPIWQWCLELCLLQNGLVEHLLVSSQSVDVRMILSRDLEHLAKNRAVVVWKDDEALIQLTDTEIEYWLTWSLKYYRDGISDVNHIDIEIVSHDGLKAIDLTLMVNNSTLPVSEIEARRRLGM